MLLENIVGNNNGGNGMVKKTQTKPNKTKKNRFTVLHKNSKSFLNPPDQQII